MDNKTPISPIFLSFHELTPESVVLQKRESVTCCGFLGGDSLMLVTTCEDLLRYFFRFKPILPPHTNIKIVPNPLQIKERWDKITDIFTPPDKKLQDYEYLQDMVSQVPSLLWFSSGEQLLRFSLQVWPDISSFLSQSGYQEKLVKTFLWWYKREATLEEREQFHKYSMLTEFSYPDHAHAIIQAINLYNHGAYELSALF